MKDKVILCRCEDVTLKDVLHSIELGYSDIEEVKRYTGFGTGPCQGKECLALVAITLAERTGRDPSSIRPFTSRSPITPTPLGLLAGGAGDGEEDR
ncbi:MAG TPA: (2Fe-2S)-binding protein [Kofleriaceae bacterium]|nr:(2Fe-2S)-binding protein [Kofleriaceae bacterium]